MPRTALTRNITFLSFAVFITLALVIAWFAPPEETLGPAARLIYLHAGLISVSLVLVTAVGLIGLLHLATGREVFLDWSRPVKMATLSFWAVYLGTSFVAMKLTWGKIVWNEPRLLLGSSIFLVLVAIYLLSGAVSVPRLVSFLNLLMGLAVWLLLSRVPSVVHPSGSPIRSSSSLGIKLSTLAITVLFLVAAVQLVRLYKEKLS